MPKCQRSSSRGQRPGAFVKLAQDLVSFAKRRGMSKIPDDSLVQEFAAGIVGHGLVASLI